VPPPDRIADPWGRRTPYDRGAEWPERVDRHGAGDDDADRWVPSASLLHSNGDAMDIAVRDGAIAGVRGRAHDRVNREDAKRETVLPLGRRGYGRTAIGGGLDGQLELVDREAGVREQL
jgi:hypothetical protein